MLANHAEREHPSRHPDAEEHAPGHEEGEGAEPNGEGAEPETGRDRRQHEDAAHPIGEPSHRQEREQVDDLGQPEQLRHPGAVQAELARARSGMRNWLIDDQASPMMIPTANMSHTMGGMRPAGRRRGPRSRPARLAARAGRETVAGGAARGGG